MKAIAVVLISSLLFASSPSAVVLQEDYEKSMQAKEGANKKERPLQIAKKLQADFENGKMAERTEAAIEAIINRATSEMEKRGYILEAALLKQEWYEHKGTLQAWASSRDIGQWPGIQFMITAHSYIESAIGETLCRRLRLHDLWTLAYVIPMSFKCAGQTQALVDEGDYTEHFSVFIGIVGYWTAYIACAVASNGTAIVTVCGLLGEAVEGLLYTFIGPLLAKKFYPKACPESRNAGKAPSCSDQAVSIALQKPWHS